ncbi:E3 ubiquitin-protein ligase Ubr3 isoform X3 [Harmonia axyridis]|uniref:E3 ubiquitin-protein ligase Ubr3 isoform X3 n=1 Tax=Harmonia axyridis TaxID=115357 RepID=UPI001E278F86|nr:E3 ubiquitin-protein ligase Ubr3 isoform X3 [Harmonia axyridis]
MASNPNFKAKVLMNKGKKATAVYLQTDCKNPTGCNTKCLNEVLDNLLNPVKCIDEWETIDWCKWLIAGGNTPDEYANTVRKYDNATTCGLVWTPNFVAYRCRTCGISPCMSLCTDCFKKGDHHRHDFNMFLSQAGGACDCGDTSVMKEQGFCDRHGPNKRKNKGTAPADLMLVAEAMMPRILFRLILHLRDNSKNGLNEGFNKEGNSYADSFINMLFDFNNMGGLMRRVMTNALTNPQKYRELNEIPDKADAEYIQYLIQSRNIYEEAVRTVPNPPPLDEYRDCPSLQEHLVHKTLLEELVFWTVKLEFPQKVVCLLLHLLPDPEYKEALTKAFVLHYSRIPMMLERSNDPDTLSNRVVHVSVQLFSNESLAVRMTEQLHLLHVMVVSLKYMMSKILIQNTLNDPTKNFHMVVDCGKSVMREHCYWPLVSDLNNVLSHRPVAFKFMEDDMLLRMWFNFLSSFQGMNVNHRELNQHVEFEPNTYYAAFSAELEASAYPMSALVSHLTDPSTAYLTRRVLTACLNEFRQWMEAINFHTPNLNDDLQVSFHLPLHRYLAVFLCTAVSKQGITLDEVLPSSETLKLLMMHPLRVQVAFYEILNGLWVRNGLQIKGQAMTYIQCNFCNTMVDADLCLLQICATRIPAEDYLKITVDNFHGKSWLSLSPFSSLQQDFNLDNGKPMMESFLIYLVTLISVRTSLGLTEREINRLEMITLLCTGDKTHSQLLESMPDRCGTTQSRDFESLLADLADYRAPSMEATGTLQQGMYMPKAQVWEEFFDPIHILLRAVHRRDFQTSMDRYTEYARQNSKIKAGMNPWPPFRTPSKVGEAFDDPRCILKSRVFHAVAFIVLFKAVKGEVSEHIMNLIIFLLEQAVIISQQSDNLAVDTKNNDNASSMPKEKVKDKDISAWYKTDNIFENMTGVIHKVVLTPEPEIFPMAYSSDTSSFRSGELEWDSNDMDTKMSEVPFLDAVNMLTYEDWDQSESGALLPWPASVPADDDDDGSAMSIEDSQENAMTMALAAFRQPHEGPQEHSALPPPAHLPALMAGNEVGRPSQLPGPSSKELVPTSSLSSELVPSTSLGNRKPRPYRRRTTLEGPNTSINVPVVKVHENLISLLLKLHSNLSGVPDSFVLEKELAKGDINDRAAIGDGPFYVGKLLKRLALADDNCKQGIVEARERIWPIIENDKGKNPNDNKEREDRRRKAKERQQKLMAEFASKQKQFMENMETNDTPPGQDEQIPLSEIEYDCVICGQSTASTESKPMGLVVLVQATSCVGHKRRHGRPERGTLPLSDDEKHLLRTEDTLASEFDKRIVELDRHFDPQSWFLSVNSGWDGGVHVQTCGHHLHLDCLNSYLFSLRSQQRQPSLSPEKGEYLCPLCRQLANSVLPLSPQLGDRSQMVSSKPTCMSQVLDELSDFLRENVPKPNVSNMSEAIGKAMEDMSSCTQLKPIFKLNNDKPSPYSLFLFITSIARTNLEVELIQRGGSLVFQEEPPNPLLPKRDCIVPLLHVLAFHARVARGMAKWAAWTTFEQLCGLPNQNTVNALANIEREVPLMLRDPIALLLQFVLLLPLHLDQIYLTTTVQMIYNLLYYQVVAQVSLGLSRTERERVKHMSSGDGNVKNLTDALGLIHDYIGHTDLYIEEDSMEGSSKPQVNLVALEQQVQKLCLPFLRIATLLKYHLYKQPLPDVLTAQSEFVLLVYYLELVTEPIDWDRFNAAAALNWPSVPKLHRASPQSWCRQLEAFAVKSQIAARGFLIDQHIRWHQPRLLQLPREYEKIFTYYHERPCSQCQSVPQEISICLLCGAIVCLKQGCCKAQNVCEAVFHTLECGAGTGIFLVVTSTYIVVIRGHRACLWGSLYLDEYEEEDRDLKRGKPLYLSEDRYKLLEQQWLAHRFDHTKKNWVQHRNAL